MESEEILKKRLLHEPSNLLLWQEVLVFYDRCLRLQEGAHLLVRFFPEDQPLRKYLGDFFWNRNIFELALENYAWLRFLDPRGLSGLKRLRELAQLFPLYRNFFSRHNDQRYLVCNEVEKKIEYFPLFLHLSLRDRAIPVRQKASQIVQHYYSSESVLPWVLNFFPKMNWMDWDTWHPFLLEQSISIQKKTLLALGRLETPEAIEIISMYLKTVPFFQKEKEWVLAHFPHLS
ncbi:MAG: hypothetical protein AABZ60_01220 [Planctomycetota bacterium]